MDRISSHPAPHAADELTNEELDRIVGGGVHTEREAAVSAGHFPPQNPYKSTTIGAILRRTAERAGRILNGQDPDPPNPYADKPPQPHA